ncbi:MAG: LptF/LptG family permease [Planctomycetota bacterium]
MIGRLDRYVLRTALTSYFAGLAFIMGMFILMHALTKLSSYAEKAERNGIGTFDFLSLFGEFYLYFLPVIFVTVAPFVTVIAGMFAVSRLMGDNEMAPMVFTGRSTIRILWPILGLAIFSAVAMGAVWEYVVPRTSEPMSITQGILENRVDPENPRLTAENLLVKIRDDGRKVDLLVTSYDHYGQRFEGLKAVDRSDGIAGISELTARAARWSEEEGDWILEGGSRTRPGPVSRPVDRLGLPSVTPDLLFRLGKEDRETAQLGYSELRDLRKLRPKRSDYEIAYHAHITFPLANIVLLLLALPFAVNFERGSKIWRVLFAIGICATYLVCDLICQSLGKSLVDPVVAVWVPPIVFGSFGVAFFGTVPS